MKNKLQEESSMTGYLMGISHIFYLPKQSKVFFLEILIQTKSTKKESDDGIKEDNQSLGNENKIDEVCSWKISRLILSLSSPCNQEVKAFSKELMQFPKLGIILKITNFKDAVLHKNTSDPSAVFQLTKKSRIQILKDDSLKDSFEKIIINNDTLKNYTMLVSYKGVVTSVKDSNCGIYKIDKKIVLVTSSLCIVSNVPKLQLGQEITLHNTHHVNVGKQKYLLMCGRSFLVAHDTVQDVHPSSHDMDNYILDPFIRLVQDLHLTAQDLLYLLENRNVVYESFPDQVTRKIILERSIRTRAPILPRSLTKEFMDHGKNCCLLRDEGGGMVRPVWTVSQLLDSVQAQTSVFNPMESGWNGKINEFVLAKGDEVGFLCGILDFNDVGRLVLKDSKNEIMILTAMDLSKRFDHLRGRLVLIESVELGIEREGVCDVLSYLVVHHCEPFTFRSTGKYCQVSTDETTEVFRDNEAEECSENVTVIAKSEVMIGKSKNNEGFYYLIYYRQESDKSSSIVKLNNLDLYHLTSADTNIQIKGEKCLQPFDVPFRNSLSSILKLDNFFSLGSKSSVTISEIQEVKSPFQCYHLGNVSEIPKNELVNIVGVVTSRSNVESTSNTRTDKSTSNARTDKFTSNARTDKSTSNARTDKSTSNARTDKLHGANFGVSITGLHVQLRLDEAEVEGVDGAELHSVYLNNWSNKLYPLGMIPGNTVQFNSVKRVISKKGHSYFQSTLLTQIQLVSTPHQDTSSRRQAKHLPELSPAKHLPAFSHLDMIHVDDLKVVDVLVTVYKVVRLSVDVECVNCGSEVKEGTCCYVGCQAKPSIAVTVKGVFEVEDGTGKAVLIVTSENVLRTFLDLGSRDWDEIVSDAKQSGGLCYFWKGGQAKSNALEKNVKRCTGVVQYFGARVRPFFPSGEDSLRLFCLGVWKPYAAQINQLFEAKSEV